MRFHVTSATIAFAVLFSAALPAYSQTSSGVFSYKGMCEASAGAALDAEHFVVGEDENNVLKIYRFGVPDPVADAIDLSIPLGVDKNNKGEFREIDIEGSARIGDRIYWIGSHGRNNSAEFRQERHRLFATDVAATGGTFTFTPVGRYADLIKDLAADPRYAKFKLADAEKKKPEAEGGLNIEGLAATTDGGLLIGLRNPRGDQDKAILAELRNPADVLQQSAKPVFGDPVQMDLGKRGIRSIERVGDAYLIIAGASGDGGDFALYSWSGRIADAPTALAADFKGIRPEGLFAIPGSKDVLIISDDGKRKTPGTKCEDGNDAPLADRAFRTIRVTLP
jgi:hypothetical protein